MNRFFSSCLQSLHMHVCIKIGKYVCINVPYVGLKFEIENREWDFLQIIPFAYVSYLCSIKTNLKEVLAGIHGQVHGPEERGCGLDAVGAQTQPLWAHILLGLEKNILLYTVLNQTLQMCEISVSFLGLHNTSQFLVFRNYKIWRAERNCN